MDETGLLYRCLPSRSFVPRRDRRHARGTKTMRQKERVTLVLCTNATGAHKLPVSMIGTAAVPLCFRGQGNACPLPYFKQKNAWMDHHVYTRWFNTVFLPGVRERHGGASVALILNISATHDVELSAPNVTLIFLPPITTAVYQPMDAGVIAALKRRYKRRLLAIVVRGLPVDVIPPPVPPSQPTPPTLLSTATSQPAAAGQHSRVSCHPPPTATSCFPAQQPSSAVLLPAVREVVDGSSVEGHGELPPSLGVDAHTVLVPASTTPAPNPSPVHARCPEVHPILAVPEVEEDAGCTAGGSYARLVAASLVPPEEVARPARNCGL